MEQKRAFSNIKFDGNLIDIFFSQLQDFVNTITATPDLKNLFESMQKDSGDNSNQVLLCCEYLSSLIIPNIFFQMDLS